MPGHPLMLYPPPAEELPEGGVYADLELPRPARGERPYVAVNMVSTIDGKAAIGGRAGDIGGRADRAAMRNLRASADAVMVGGGTIRAEKISLGVPEHLAARRVASGKPPQPLAVFLTRSGELPLRTNLVGFSPENAVVLVPENGTVSPLPDGARAQEIETDRSGWVDLASALEFLGGGCSVGRLLVEGGPSLNLAMVRRGLVDDLFITISPRLLGGTAGEAPTVLEGKALAPQTRPSTELSSVHLSGSELFLRYSLA